MSRTIIETEACWVTTETSCRCDTKPMDGQNEAFRLIEFTTDSNDKVDATRVFPWSSTQEVGFDTKPSDVEHATIKSIKFATDSNGRIDTIEVEYRGAEEETRSNGFLTHKLVGLDLDEDEWIITFEQGISSPAGYIVYLKLQTNKGRAFETSPSRPKSTISAFSVHQGPSPSYGVLWLGGTRDRYFYIGELVVGFATYPVSRFNPELAQPTAGETRKITSSYPTIRPICVKYEKGTDSKFFRTLISPTVTLLVGTPAVSFTIDEVVVSELPCFPVLVKKNSYDNITRTVKMPGDDSSTIAALLEFQKLGFYTYAYRNEGELPDCDVHQATFHLKLYAASVKYKCDELAVTAMVAARAILRDLSSRDLLKVWQQAYGFGVSMEDMEVDGGSKLKAKLRDLYQSNPGIISEIVHEHPGFVKEFVKLMIK